MRELVECSECGTSYDSQEHPFCPRCGSTARGAPVPGAVASAARRDPARRRVQASGGVLLAIGLLFLGSTAVTVLVPDGGSAEPLVDLLATQPGGRLTVVFPSDAAANVTFHATGAGGAGGAELGHATAEGGRAEADLPRASVVVRATQGEARWNRTVVVLDGDALALELPEGGDAGGAGEGEPVLGGTVRAILRGTTIAMAVVAAVLVAGGIAALTLRAFALAATAAGIGAFLGLLALFSLLLVGLLFAVPFGMAAYFIVRGRRHFRGKAPPA